LHSLVYSAGCILLIRINFEGHRFLQKSFELAENLRIAKPENEFVAPKAENAYRRGCKALIDISRKLQY